MLWCLKLLLKLVKGLSCTVKKVHSVIVTTTVAISGRGTASLEVFNALPWQLHTLSKN